MQSAYLGAGQQQELSLGKAVATFGAFHERGGKLVAHISGRAARKRAYDHILKRRALA